MYFWYFLVHVCYKCVKLLLVFIFYHYLNSLYLPLVYFSRTLASPSRVTTHTSESTSSTLAPHWEGTKAPASLNQMPHLSRKCKYFVDHFKKGMNSMEKLQWKVLGFCSTIHQIKGSTSFSCFYLIMFLYVLMIVDV